MLKTLAFNLSTNYSLSVIAIFLTIFIALSTFALSVYFSFHFIKKLVNVYKNRRSIPMCTCKNNNLIEMPCNNYMCLYHMPSDSSKLNCHKFKNEDVMKCECYISPIKHECRCSTKIDT